MRATKLEAQDDEEAAPLKRSAGKKDRRRILGLPAAVVTGASWCTASTSMVGVKSTVFVAEFFVDCRILCGLRNSVLPPTIPASMRLWQGVVPQFRSRQPRHLCPLPPPPSVCQVLLNKVALSSFAFHSANALLFFQCALAVALVQACKAAGFVQVEQLRWAIVRIWLPVNLIFVAMIATSFYALQNLNVAMITGVACGCHVAVCAPGWCTRCKQHQMGRMVCCAVLLASSLRSVRCMLQVSTVDHSTHLACRHATLAFCSAEEPDQPVHVVRRLCTVRADVPAQCVGVRGPHAAVSHLRWRDRSELQRTRLLLAGAVQKVSCCGCCRCCHCLC